MSHSTVAQAGPSTRTRGRLSREGSALLQNYARTVTSNPSRAEKRRLLATLRAMPGNEEFTCQKLNGWFTRHRSSGDLVDDETILFPKFTPTHLQQLRLLYKKRPDPSDDIITFWAGRIRAEKSEVEAWIRYQRAKAQEDKVCTTTPESPEIPLQQLVRDPASEGTSASASPTVSEFPRPHLPTPAKSPSISPQTRIPSLPPIAVKVEEPRQCLSPVSSLGTPSSSKPTLPPSEPRSVLEGLPPMLRLFERARPSLVSPFVPDAQLRVDSQDPNKMLAASIRDSLRPRAAPSEQPPRTAGEFAEMFERVEDMAQAFLNKYDTGQLSGLGWDSSLSRAVL